MLQLLSDVTENVLKVAIIEVDLYLISVSQTCHLQSFYCLEEDAPVKNKSKYNDEFYSIYFLGMSCI